MSAPTPRPVSWWAAGGVLVLALGLPAGAAADTAYVDGSGVCGGLVPCFTTIQAAVVATAAPAEIFVFPGTYAETVDLAQMNGGVKGDVSLTTVDGAGTPTPGTASIEPPLLAAILHDQAEATPFTGDVLIDGFIVESVNDDGIELENVDGDVTVRNVLATGNGSDGLDIEIVTPGRVLTVTDTEASINLDDGFHIEMRSAGGEVRLTRVTTEGNGSDGVEVNADDPMFFDVLLVITELASNGNGADGLDVDTGGSVEIADSELASNGDDGIDVTVAGDVEIVDTDTFFNFNFFFDGTGVNLAAGGEIVLRRLTSEDNDVDLAVEGFDADDPPDLLVMTQSTIGPALEGALLFELAPGADHLLRCNRFSFFEGAGLVLLADVAIDAELNWWANPTGPDHPGNPGGTGTDVVDGANGGAGTVDYLPFLTVDPADEPSVCSEPPTLEAIKSDAVAVDDGDGVTGPGDVIEYTVTITHESGVLEVEDVVFSDPVPADTTLVPAAVTTTQGTVVSGNDPADSAVVVDVGTIFPGGAVTITFRVVIDDPLAAGVTEVSNQGTVAAAGLTDEPTDDPDTPADDDPTVTPLAAAPAIAVFKSDALLADANGNGAVDPGDTLRYTVVISNLGNQDAAGVVFTDLPDPHTALVVGSVTTTQGAVVTGNGAGDVSVEVALGTLAGGGSATVELDVLVLDTFPSLPAVVLNQGVVDAAGLPSTPSDDPDTPDAGDPTATPVVASPAVVEIPTLGEGALTLLALLLAAAGVAALRR